MSNGESEIIEANKLSSDSVIVVGIVKNIGKTIKRDLEKLEESLGFFKEVHWFVVESGSSDNSKAILEELAKQNSNFNYKSINIIADSELMRTENMAKARNKYLAFLRNTSRINDYSYVIVADFNLLNKKISRKSLLSSWEQTDWDVVTANQSGPYYDIWALRHPLWSPNDCWEHHAFLRKYVKFPEKATTYAMRSRMLTIPRNSEWIKVDSAFGGLAIYKSKILKSGSLYSGKNSQGQRICEHVPLHNHLTNEGARIFINPGMINARYTDHSRRMTFRYFMYRASLYPYKKAKRFFNF